MATRRVRMMDSECENSSKSWSLHRCSLAAGIRRGSRSVCCVVPTRRGLRVADRRHHMRCYRRMVPPGSYRTLARSILVGCSSACPGTRRSCRSGWRQSRRRMRWMALDVRRPDCCCWSSLVLRQEQRCHLRRGFRGGRSLMGRWSWRPSRHWLASWGSGIRRGCWCCPSRSCRW